ncbi:MAG: transposase [Salinivirgaceae bacterium]|nr:transposase [Salinivirgaceae bacterium]MDD4747293.1 transposase [Salinivirgaceae bacterium]MDY0280911.1 transposase [Salinivirgaceae bacterium]
MKKRTFNKEEKLRIIKEASENGISQTLEKYGIYPASYYSWKKKLEEMGEEGFHHGMTPQHLKRIRELEKENSSLKQLLAEKELENKLKGELLKKKYALEKKKK